MSRVLLTGASGFIGSHVLEALLECGHEVHAVSRVPPDAEASSPEAGAEWHAADLLAPDTAETLVASVRPERLLHLAWYATPGRFWMAPENERWLDASLRLTRAFCEAGGERVVMAGTCAEYAWGADVLDERATPLLPATIYGACKHATRVAAAAIAQSLGPSFAWGRIFYPYGPREDSGRLIPSVARGLLAHEPVPTTDGRQLRDFMHVCDVAAAFAMLLGADLSGPVNICSGEPVPIRDVIELAARHAGAPDLLRVGQLPQRAGEPPRIVGGLRRLRDELLFRPAIDLDAGIEMTVDWWRRRLGSQ